MAEEKSDAAPAAKAAAPAAKAEGAPKEAKKTKGKGKGKGKSAKGKGKAAIMAAMAKGKGKGKGKVAAGKGKMPGLMMARPKARALMKASAKASAKARGARPKGLPTGAMPKALGGFARRSLLFGAMPKAAGGKGGLVMGKGMVIPPLRGPPAKKVPWRKVAAALRAGRPLEEAKAKGAGRSKGAANDAEEPDYDPFSTEPTAEVKAASTKGKKLVGRAKASGKKSLLGPKKGQKLSPWRMAQAAAEAALAAEDEAMTEAEQARAWLSRGPNKRMIAAAYRAMEYFKHADAAPEDGKPAKKARVALPSFSEGLLTKAPDNLQTCRSLLTFLDKKIAEVEKSVPPVEAPKDLHPALEMHAATLGRLEGLKIPGGWDARAKRVLDISAIMATPEGQAAMKAAEERAAKEKPDLEAQLKERGEAGVDTAIKERLPWEKEHAKRQWLAWCAKLLRAKEAVLLSDADKEKAKAPEKAEALGPVGVLEALLKGL